MADKTRDGIAAADAVVVRGEEGDGGRQRRLPSSWSVPPEAAATFAKTDPTRWSDGRSRSPPGRLPINPFVVEAAAGD